nr:hypothetical protein BaRGS_025986 [Batillaria attramentaria]
MHDDGDEDDGEPGYPNGRALDSQCSGRVFESRLGPHWYTALGNSAHEEDDDHKSQSAVDAASIDIGDPDLFLIPAPAFPVPQAPPPLTHAGIVADTAGVLQPLVTIMHLSDEGLLVDPEN